MLIRHWSTFKKPLRDRSGTKSVEAGKAETEQRLCFAAVLLMTGGPVSGRFSFSFYHFILVLFGATPGGALG